MDWPEGRSPCRRGNTLIEWRDPVILPRGHQKHEEEEKEDEPLAALFAQLGRDLAAGKELQVISACGYFTSPPIRL